MIDSDAIIKIATSLAPVIAAILPFVLSLNFIDRISNIMQKKIRVFLFSCPNFKRFLDIDKIWIDYEKYDYTSYLILLAAALVILFRFFILNLPILLICSILLNGISILIFILFLTLFCFKRLKNYFKIIIKIYNIFRGIIYGIAVIGVLSSILLYQSNYVAEILVVIIYFYSPLIFDYLVQKNIRRIVNDVVNNKLITSIRNSPEITVFTSRETEKISGKLKTLYNKDFLILQIDNKDIMIPWGEIKLVKC